MLNHNDVQYLDNNIKSFKTSFFQLVSDFGPQYTANFMLASSDIKSQAERERLTNVTLSLYEDYLRSHGFQVKRTDIGISLSLNAHNIVTVGNEAVDLSNSLKEFRSRAKFNGDVENM